MKDKANDEMMTYMAAQEQLVWELQHFHRCSEVHWRMLIRNRSLHCWLGPFKPGGMVGKKRKRREKLN